MMVADESGSKTTDKIGISRVEQFSEQVLPDFRNLALDMFKHYLRVLFAVLIFQVLMGPLVYGQERRNFTVTRASAPPKIDGRLDDDIWQGPPLPLGDWISYNPLAGEKSPFLTDVRVAYDDRNLYFAFHCFDEEPDKIRTTDQPPGQHL